MSRLSNNKNDELRAKVALILSVECDLRPDDLHNVYSCNAFEKHQHGERPAFVIELPSSKNNAEGHPSSTNVVVCSCDAEAFTNTAFDPDCSYHVLKCYKEQIPSKDSASLLFLRGLINANGFKRVNCGMNTIYT